MGYASKISLLKDLAEVFYGKLARLMDMAAFTAGKPWKLSKSGMQPAVIKQLTHL
jgi:hypothetical protein